MFLSLVMCAGDCVISLNVIIDYEHKPAVADVLESCDTFYR